MSETRLIQALARGLDLLVLLAEAEGGLSLKAISERAGLKKNTAHNLLRTLRARGFAQQAAGSPAYVLGPRLGQLCARSEASSLLARMEQG